MDEISRAAFRGWHQTLGGSDSTKAAIVRACRALWNWAISEEPQIATTDATAGLLITVKHKGGDAEILTVAECAAIMKHAGRYRSALAVLLFSGIRPEELAGRGKDPLLWGAFDREARIIRVPANIAKTGKARIIEGLPDTLWRWLQPGGALDRVCPARTRQALEAAQAAVSRPWPHDCTRHSFATYALALTGDPGRVSTWLGHEGNTSMLHRHYRGLTTKAEAEKFWAITA